MGAEESKPAEQVPKHVPMPATTQNKFIDNASMLDAKEAAEAEDRKRIENLTLRLKQLNDRCVYDINNLQHERAQLERYQQKLKRTLSK